MKNKLHTPRLRRASYLAQLASLIHQNVFLSRNHATLRCVTYDFHLNTLYSFVAINPLPLDDAEGAIYKRTPA
jgi:hypothetical protein